MNVNSIVKDSTEVKPINQSKPITELEYPPDYQRFEQLKAELSPELNAHEYTNAVRAIADEFGVRTCVEQQTHPEWLAAHESAEVCA